MYLHISQQQPQGYRSQTRDPPHSGHLQHQARTSPTGTDELSYGYGQHTGSVYQSRGDPQRGDRRDNSRERGGMNRDSRDGRDSRGGSGRDVYSNTSVVQDRDGYRANTGQAGAGYGGQNYDRSPPSQRQAGGGYVSTHAQGSRDTYTQPTGSYAPSGHNYDQGSSYGIGSVYGARPTYPSHHISTIPSAANQTTRYSATSAINNDTYNPNRGQPFSFLNTTTATTASYLTPSSLQRQQQQVPVQSQRNSSSSGAGTGAGTGFNSLQAMRQQLTQQQQQQGAGRR